MGWLALVTAEEPVASARRWTYAQLLAESERLARALVRHFRTGRANRRVCTQLRRVGSAAALGQAWRACGWYPHGSFVSGGVREVVLRAAGATGIFHTNQFRDNDVTAVVSQLSDQMMTSWCTRCARGLLGIGQPSAASLPRVIRATCSRCKFTSSLSYGIPKGALLHHKGVINSSRFAAQRAGFPDSGVWVDAMCECCRVGGGAVCRMAASTNAARWSLACSWKRRRVARTDRERAREHHVGRSCSDRSWGCCRTTFALRDLLSVVGGCVLRRSRRRACRSHGAKPNRRSGADSRSSLGKVRWTGGGFQTRLSERRSSSGGDVGIPMPHLVEVEDPPIPVMALLVPVGRDGEILMPGLSGDAGLHRGAGGDERHDGRGGVAPHGRPRHDGRAWAMSEVPAALKDMIIRGGLNLYPREIGNLPV